MRKLLFISLAFAGCLLFSGRSIGAADFSGVPTAVLSIGGADADQWQCEQIYNSDLNQPRIIREAEACPAVLLFRPAGHLAQRAALRCVTSCGCGTGVVKQTSVFRSSDLFAGRCVPDDYVCRLRRLII